MHLPDPTAWTLFFSSSLENGYLNGPFTTAQHSTPVNQPHGDMCNVGHWIGRPSPLTLVLDHKRGRIGEEGRNTVNIVHAWTHLFITRIHTHMHTHSLLSVVLLGDCSPINPLAPTLTSSSTAMYSSWMFMDCSKLYTKRQENHHWINHTEVPVGTGVSKYCSA